jgi:hypothetical protein
LWARIAAIQTIMARQHTSLPVSRDFQGRTSQVDAQPSDARRLPFPTPQGRVEKQSGFAPNTGRHQPALFQIPHHHFFPNFFPP